MPARLVTIADDTTTVYVDATIQETHTLAATTTDFPVEGSFDGTDSVQPKPRQYAMQGVFTNTPISTTARESAPGVAGPAEEAAAQMRDFLLKGRLLTIATEHQRYENFVMLEFTVPRSAEIGEALRFSATFKEIRIVQSQSVRLRALDKKPVPKDPKKATEGTDKQPKQTAEEAGPKEKKTLLLKAAEAGKAFLGG